MEDGINIEFEPSKVAVTLVNGSKSEIRDVMRALKASPLLLDLVVKLVTQNGELLLSYLFEYVPGIGGLYKSYRTQSRITALLRQLEQLSHEVSTLQEYSLKNLRCLKTSIKQEFIRLEFCYEQRILELEKATMPETQLVSIIREVCLDIDADPAPEKMRSFASLILGIATATGEERENLELYRRYIRRLTARQMRILSTMRQLEKDSKSIISTNSWSPADNSKFLGRTEEVEVYGIRVPVRFMTDLNQTAIFAICLDSAIIELTKTDLTRLRLLMGELSGMGLVNAIDSWGTSATGPAAWTLSSAYQALEGYILVEAESGLPPQGECELSPST